MKKLFIFIIFVVIIAILAALTCPKPEQHYCAATDKLAEEVAVQMSEHDTAEIRAGLGIATKPIIKLFVKNNLFIDDYVVCNIGKFVYEGEVYPLTFGIFNHVFVLSDYIDDILEDQ